MCWVHWEAANSKYVRQSGETPESSELAQVCEDIADNFTEAIAALESTQKELQEKYGESSKSSERRRVRQKLKTFLQRMLRDIEALLPNVEAA